MKTLKTGEINFEENYWKLTREITENLYDRLWRILLKTDQGNSEKNIEKKSDSTNSEKNCRILTKKIMKRDKVSSEED